MPKHTPGPWKLERCNPSGGLLIEDPNAGQHTIIATVWESRPETQAADARLIAAAPDMLAALEALFAHCAIVQKYWGENSNARAADAAQAAGRAAIAKAKGAA